MRISYRLANLSFFILYLVPVLGMGYFVQERVQQRQTTLQLFLQNQADIDRKILSERGILRNIQPRIRQVLLGNGTNAERREVLAVVEDDYDMLATFWAKYLSSYAATERPFLQSVLAETQELGLIEEEARAVRDIQRKIDSYVASIRSYPPLASGAPANTADLSNFFSALDEQRLGIYDSLNELADIRYIFAQRIIFFASGENALQQGLFNTVFVALFLIFLVVTLLEYYSVRRPLGDIMLFLKDLAAGKRGQRLYFSSPIREIKQSEDAINAFVEHAEAHEKERRP